MITDDDYIELYLSWCNDFVTLEAFCEYYGFTEEIGAEIIERGRKLNETVRD